MTGHTYTLSPGADKHASKRMTCSQMTFSYSPCCFLLVNHIMSLALFLLLFFLPVSLYKCLLLHKVFCLVKLLCFQASIVIVLPAFITVCWHPLFSQKTSLYCQSFNSSLCLCWLFCFLFHNTRDNFEIFSAKQTMHSILQWSDFLLISNSSCVQDLFIRERYNSHPLAFTPKCVCFYTFI